MKRRGVEICEAEGYTSEVEGGREKLSGNKENRKGAPKGGVEGSGGNKDKWGRVKRSREDRYKWGGVVGERSGVLGDISGVVIDGWICVEISGEYRDK